MKKVYLSSILFLFVFLHLTSISFADTEDNSKILNGDTLPKGIYEIIVNSPYSMSDIQEGISESSGSLTISQTDLTLPGKNGLDFNLTRFYSSNTANLGNPKAIGHDNIYTIPDYLATRIYHVYQCNNNYIDSNCFYEGTDSPSQRFSSYSSANSWANSGSDYWVNRGGYWFYYSFVGGNVTDYSQTYYSFNYENTIDPLTYEEKKYNLGSGWRFAFPSIEISNGFKFLHFEDGSVYKVLSDNQLDNYSLKDITFSDTNETIGQEAAKYKITNTLGKSTYFNSEGNWIGTKDAYGNQITIKYITTPINGGTQQHKVIDSITDSLGRIIQFTYETNSVKVGYEGKSITYTKQALTGETNEMVLNSYTNEIGEVTDYTYVKNATTFDFEISDSTYGEGTIKYANLTGITYPTGSKTQYTYGESTKNLGNTGILKYFRVTERKDIVNNIDVNMIQYQYDTNNFSGYPAYRTPESLPESFSYTNKIQHIPDPSSTVTPKPFRLQSSQKYNHKHLNIDTTLSIDNDSNLVASKLTRTFNSTTKLLEQIKTTNFSGTNSSTTTDSFTYDSYGNLLTAINPKGYEKRFTYSTSFPGLYTSLEEKYGSTRIKFEERSISTTKPEVTWVKEHFINDDGIIQIRQTDFTYDTFGNVKQIITGFENGKQQKTEIIYQDNAYPSSVKKNVTLPNNTVEVVEEKFYYDILGRLIGFHDAKAVKKGMLVENSKYQYGYDSIGRLTSITYPLVSGESVRNIESVSYVIDSLNQKSYTETTDEEGKIKRTVFDGLGRKIQTKEQDQSNVLTTISTTTYNALGQIESVMDGKGNKTTYQYDPLGRVTLTTFQDQSMIKTSYDDAGRKVTTTDQLGNIRVDYFDEINRVIQHDQKDINVNKTISTYTQFEYINNPFQISEKDYNGNQTVYQNNGLGKLNKVTKWVKGVSEVTSYRYNLQGLMIQKTLSDGSTTKYQYDELNRLLSKTDPLNQIETYQYDVNGNRIETIDRNKVVQTLQYDELNRLKATSKGTQTISYTYYKNGQRKTMTDGVGTTQYLYYPNAALKTITYPDGKMLDYQYDKTGNPTSLNEPFGQKVNYQYDGLNRLDYITKGTNPLKEIDINYDLKGRVSEAIQGNGFKTKYTYDGFNNLTSLAHHNTSGTVIGSYIYKHDNNGNILTKTENGPTHNFTYDELDRISTSTEGNQTYGYDGKGNRLTLSGNLQFSGDSIEYKYDEFNRLTQVKKNGVIISEYRYNGDNLLVEMNQDGVKTRYYYDGDQIIAEGIVGSNGQVTLKARYLRAANQLIHREDSSGAKGYYLHNGHGDVIGIRDQSGTLLNSYTYDIWGNPTSSTGTTPNLFRYSGEFWDEKASIQYLRARWYDPSQGRFITEDTYEGDIKNPLTLNSYTYVHNNPLKYSDPTGHCVACIGGKNLDYDFSRGREYSWQDMLDTIGYVPVIGEWADGTNALIYLFSGDYTNAGISASGMIPFVGNGKALLKGSDYLQFFSKGIDNIKVISSIKKDPRLIKAAEQMGKDKRIQKEADNLVARLQQGNFNPGKGNNSIGFGGIHELRGDNGARVYFRNINGGIEILAKSNKDNQGTVINVLRQLYGK